MFSATTASCVIPGDDYVFIVPRLDEEMTMDVKDVELPLMAQIESNVSEEAKVEEPAEKIGRNNIVSAIKTTIKKLLPFAGNNERNTVGSQEITTGDAQLNGNKNGFHGGNDERNPSKFVTNVPISSLPAVTPTPAAHVLVEPPLATGSPDAKAVTEHSLSSKLDTTAYESALDETILCTPGSDPIGSKEIQTPSHLSSLESTYYDATRCTLNSLGSPEISIVFANSNGVLSNSAVDLESTGGQEQKGELVVVRRKKQLLPECCPKRPKRKSKPVVQAYSSDDDDDTSAQLPQRVVRSKTRQSDLEALHDIENPKPSTSAALVREMARLKKLMKKELSGRNSHKSNQSSNNSTIPTRFSTRRAAGNSESNPIVASFPGRLGRVIPTESKLSVRVKNRRIESEEPLVPRRLSLQFVGKLKPKSVSSRKRKTTISALPLAQSEPHSLEPALLTESKIKDSVDNENNSNPSAQSQPLQIVSTPAPLPAVSTRKVFKRETSVSIIPRAKVLRQSIEVVEVKTEPHRTPTPTRKRKSKRAAVAVVQNASSEDVTRLGADRADIHDVYSFEENHELSQLKDKESTEDKTHLTLGKKFKRVPLPTQIEAAPISITSKKPETGAKNILNINSSSNEKSEAKHPIQNQTSSRRRQSSRPSVRAVPAETKSTQMDIYIGNETVANNFGGAVKVLTQTDPSQINVKDEIYKLTAVPQIKGIKRASKTVTSSTIPRKGCVPDQVKSVTIIPKRKHLGSPTPKPEADAIPEPMEINRAITTLQGNEKLSNIIQPLSPKPSQIFLGSLTNGTKPVPSKIIARNSTEVNRNVSNGQKLDMVMKLQLTPVDANRNNDEGCGNNSNEGIRRAVPLMPERNRRNVRKVEYNERSLQQMKTKNTFKLPVNSAKPIKKSTKNLISDTFKLAANSTKPVKKESTNNFPTDGILSFSGIKSRMSPVVLLTQTDRVGGIVLRQEEETCHVEVSEETRASTDHFVRRSVRERKRSVIPDV